ncbi:hypothetical protein ACJ4V0_15875 [Phreatobacter sp. HK31-P]
MSFWGHPTHTPATPELMKAINQFHERARTSGRDVALKVAHVTLKASALFIASTDPKDAMASLDAVRHTVETERIAPDRPR